MAEKTETMVFRPLQLIYDLLEKHVLDINTLRSTNPDKKIRRWIYPTFPEREAVYPLITIHTDNMTLENAGAGNNWQNTFYNNDLICETSAIRIIMPLTIRIHIKKNVSVTEVVLWNNTKQEIKNEALLEFLLDRVMTSLLVYRDEIHKNRVNIELLGVEKDDNLEANTLVRSIKCEMRFMKVWQKDINPESIIKNIDLSITVN